MADIAYTNKGDVALTDVLLTNDVFQTVTCYSGWNTASNTIGTVLAHYQISKQYVDTKDAAKAALAFKLTRYSEDQIYQGHISNNLRGQLSQAKQMDYTTAFVDAAAYEVATNTLTKAFAPYGEKLKALAVGEQQILPGYTFRCKGADYMVSFPWMRAFEIEAEWDIK